MRRRDAANGGTPGYANGRRILPRKLLRELQKHWIGLLWVPPPARRRFKTVADSGRNLAIIREWRCGRTMKELSERYLLCRERIRQILRRVQQNN